MELVQILAPHIQMVDDASEDEIWDMSRWLWCRNFEQRHGINPDKLVITEQ